MSDKAFDKLKKLWYKKLEKSGFKDIEQDEDNLKVWTIKLSTSQYKNGPEKQTYYYMASQFLNTHEFKNHIDRIIWEYHCEGISYRNISKLLRKARVSKLTYNGIYLRIKNLSKIMFETYE